LFENIDQDFSQYGEQSLILDYFDKHPGSPRYCVDVGAFDGVTGSNSRALFLSGWSGLVIEPDPRTFARVSSLYANTPNIACLRRALSNRPGIRWMQFCKGPRGTPREIEWQYAQVNTFSRSWAAFNASGHDYQYRTSLVRVTTLTRALRWARAPRDIGFMSIDCEGEDLAVIMSLDLKVYRPQLICVECDDESRDSYTRHLAASGYELHAATPANSLFHLPVATRTRRDQ
jgi:FkbM family methyltransferase